MAVNPTRLFSSRKRLRTFVFAAAATSLFVSAGCSQLAALTYFLLPDHGQPAPVQLTKGRQKKTIAVLVYADNNIKFAFDALDRDLMTLLRLRIENGDSRFTCKTDKEMREFIKANPKWIDMSRQEIGEALDVDYVFFVDIRRFSLNETKNQLLLQGAAGMEVAIHDVGKDVDVHTQSYNRDYPTNRQVQISDIASEDEFRKRFLACVSLELAWIIVPHERGEEIAIEKI